MTPKESDAVAITRINEFRAKAGRAAHQTAAKAIPPSKIQAVVPLLEAPASGAYFMIVGGAEE